MFAAPDPGYPAGGTVAPGVPPAGYGGYGGYGVPAAGGYYGYPIPVAAPKTNSLAIASMVVSITGMVLLSCYGAGGLISVVGAILGHVSRRQIRERQEGGDGMALAGIIVGWIATGLAVLVVAALVVLFVVIANAPVPEQEGVQVP